jgi:hypothetical protein
MGFTLREDEKNMGSRFGQGKGQSVDEVEWISRKGALKRERPIFGWKRSLGRHGS